MVPLLSSQSRYNLLLLLQASGGMFLAMAVVFHPFMTGESEVTALYWFSLVVLGVNIVIFINCFVYIFTCISRRKWEYEDLEKGDRMDNLNSAELEKETERWMKKKEQKFKSWEAKLLKKEKELRKMEKDSKLNESASLYGSYGYCNYGHYHAGRPSQLTLSPTGYCNPWVPWGG